MKVADCSVPRSRCSGANIELAVECVLKVRLTALFFHIALSKMLDDLFERSCRELGGMTSQLPRYATRVWRVGGSNASDTRNPTSPVRGGEFDGNRHFINVEFVHADLCISIKDNPVRIRRGRCNWISDSVAAHAGHYLIAQGPQSVHSLNRYVGRICQQRPQEVCAGVRERPKHYRRFVCHKRSGVGSSADRCEEPVQISMEDGENLALRIVGDGLGQTVIDDVAPSSHNSGFIAPRTPGPARVKGAGSPISATGRRPTSPAVGSLTAAEWAMAPDRQNIGCRRWLQYAASFCHEVARIPDKMVFDIAVFGDVFVISARHDEQNIQLSRQKIENRGPQSYFAVRVSGLPVTERNVEDPATGLVQMSDDRINLGRNQSPVVKPAGGVDNLPASQPRLRLEVLPVQTFANVPICSNRAHFGTVPIVIIHPKRFRDTYPLGDDALQNGMGVVDSRIDDPDQRKVFIRQIDVPDVRNCSFQQPSGINVDLRRPVD